ncbi:M23 family metallopeptidase [Corynebacterium glucuronolyticum]|uniref:M23 family metallopeptidase n=1 Tax=Corynebacterium glucuronolyticum TaxID=39791 RepID=UPI001E58EB60|nr:M23 family metallopeptidase [Corynebacterium glucuronolyticum]
MVEGTFRVSSGFGRRWGSPHLGVDLAAPHGTPIYAVADGVVVQGRERPQGSVAGFGSWIWIDCQASVGRDFIYGHVHHPGILVQAGDRVRAGQQIGVVGNEGQSTGPHLHFEEWTAPGRLGVGLWIPPGGWHHTPAPARQPLL